jgi:uncharacterized zinc-type alcohol dehydrogenase-like protein
MKTLGYAAQSATSPLEPFTFQRRALRPNDIVMEILYCGICHTDLHQVRNDWGFTQYDNVIEPIIRFFDVGKFTAPAENANL